MIRRIRYRKVGFVYFLEDEVSHLIKIGHSTFPHHRRQQLAYITKHPLRLLAVTVGSRETERELHVLFKEDAVGHEWFRPSARLGALISFIQAFQVTRDRAPSDPIVTLEGVPYELAAAS